jgi:heptaprenyl diphosphate synthase
MLSLSPEWVKEDMARVEEMLVESAGKSIHPLVSEASTHLIKAGGKRVRPALVLLSARAGTQWSKATDLAAAAIELVHLATLYHDDVIDETETRRGVPTVHSRWGVEVAVLAGDYLFARGCALGAQAGGEVPGILAGAIAEVCEGQIVETASLDDPRRAVSEYLETIRRKTAALFRAASELGAATSEAALPRRAALVRFGENLGLAFQIVDDVLDLIGDPEVTGKIPGTDLREGVFTLPVLIACERDPRLIAMLSNGERDLHHVSAVLETTGAVGAALEIATGHAESATRALNELPTGEWRSVLQSLVEAVMAQVPHADGTRAART